MIELYVHIVIQAFSSNIKSNINVKPKNDIKFKSLNVITLQRLVAILGCRIIVSTWDYDLAFLCLLSTFTRPDCLLI